jgi:hypothetical protein
VSLRGLGQSQVDDRDGDDKQGWDKAAERGQDDVSATPARRVSAPGPPVVVPPPVVTRPPLDLYGPKDLSSIHRLHATTEAMSRNHGCH